MQVDNWTNCYDLGWQNIIHPAAFGHPAKYARGLISRIVKHAIDEGLLQPGSTVLDPFGGVALGAWAALQHGLNYIGVELEYHFHHLGQGWGCPGFDQATWRRYHGRARRVFKGRGEWLFCPDCAETIDRIPVAVASMFGNSNGRMIPTGPAHRFAGNIERWQKMYPHLSGSAQLLQGDSRNLAEVIGAAGLVVGSPPYAEQPMTGGKPSETNWSDGRKRKVGVSQNHNDGYGSTPGQLATLPPGTPPTALISSPPFAGNSGGRGEASRNGIDAALFDRHSGGMIGGMGDEPGNLGNLPMGNIGAVISSPPFSDSYSNGGDQMQRFTKLGHQPEGRGELKSVRGDDKGYGSAPGQLGAMVVGSPPFADSVGSDNPDKRGLIGKNKENDYDTERTGPTNIEDVPLRNEHNRDSRKVWSIGYGDTVPTQEDERTIEESKRSGSKRLQDGPGQSVSTDGQLPANAGADRGQSGEGSRRETLELEGWQASARIQAKDQEGEMRDLQREGETTDSPQGLGSLQQRADEPPGTLPDLSWEATCGDTDSGQKPGAADSKIKRAGRLEAQLVVGSPPFSESLASAAPDKRKGLFRDEKRRNDTNLTGTYGQTPGQLGGMKAGAVSAVVGSPPFEKAQTGGGIATDPSDRRNRYASKTGGYRQDMQGEAEGQLASESGDTFWAAARLIVEQCYQILPPNACAIWVVKNYIKNGAEVDFTGQWQALCEACGFETVHIHRAMLVKENGEQETMAAGHDTTGTTTNLLGEEVTTAGKALVNKKNRIQRKSFFRLLAEKKGAPPIDWETVLCMVKPASPRGTRSVVSAAQHPCGYFQGSPERME